MEQAGGAPREGGRRIMRLADLGTLPPLPRGTAVYVKKTNDLFFRVGMTRPEIAARIGWTQENGWLHDRDRGYIVETKPVFPDLFVAIEELLVDPLSVHDDRRSTRATYFVMTRGALRQYGMRTNSPNKRVDGVVKWIEGDGGGYLRLTHFSPVHQNQGLRQLWP